jgi:hypothetical protein
MGIIVIGPKPGARIVGIVETGSTTPTSYAIMDGNELLAIFPKLSHAQALLPLIQSGD